MDAGGKTPYNGPQSNHLVEILSLQGNGHLIGEPSQATLAVRAADCTEAISRLDGATAQQQFRRDVLAGLSAAQKSLPCKYLYDARGSALFDRICELEEYYPTRVESSIMQAHASQMGASLGREAIVVELGSGSSLKTRVLLSHLPQPRAYLPVDISEEHLLSTAERLQGEYPELEIAPQVADFTRPFALPLRFQAETTSAYFPGSTIGNLPASEAVELLSNIAGLCGARGGLLIGFDLLKDSAVLERAYNDASGVTAEFNLNLLRRMNRELQANFVLSQFAHEATFNAQASRIEISIASRVDQTVTIAGRQFSLAAGERILTEYSHKYTLDGFSQLAERGGLRMQRVWSDARRYFAVAYLTAV
ncbi:MAG: L-histidine N(alpha)-methyltransferase [Planctomycetales bacterium]|nr:L-histidine N(alpha)-methyltransferase [Planctomycetales bacterium]